MDLKLFQDLLILAETGNFTRAAEARHVTQPAFSRRIKSLEHWCGVELIDRTVHPTRLTPVGLAFLDEMREIMERVHVMRAEMIKQASHGKQLTISTQHTLSISFCPAWLAGVRDALAGQQFRIDANNLHDCVEQFLTGNSDLLLLYNHSTVHSRLDSRDYIRTTLGSDELVPVCTPLALESGLVAENSGQRTRLVNFPPESFFGRIVQQRCLSQGDGPDRFELIFETALSDGIRALVLSGAGMAWLPRNLVQQDLDNGQLILVDHLPRVPLEITLSALRRDDDPVFARLWSVLIGQIPNAFVASTPK